jgi:hypothetical protein
MSKKKHFDTALFLRISTEQDLRWKLAARERGTKLAKFVRLVVDREARKPVPQE